MGFDKLKLLKLKAILIGIWVAIVAAFPGLIFANLIAPDDAFRYLGHHPADHTVAHMLAMLVSEIAFSMFVGIIVGRLAPRAPVLNAAAMSVLSTAIASLLAYCDSHLNYRYPTWFSVADIAGTFVFSCRGGWVAKKWPARPIVRKSKLRTFINFFGWLILSIVVDMGSVGIDVYVISPSATIVARLEALAEAGNADAEYQLGMLYFEGRGVPKSYSRTTELMKSAAEQDNAKAQRYLGVMLLMGQAMSNNGCLEAYEWLALAERQSMKEPFGALERAKACLKPDQIAEGDRWVEDWKPVSPPHEAAHP